PIAYREVVITRRLSRSGQSDYLLNGAPVRLRDIQDLLRGTGLGSDAGVVIEAKMIELLLSDRAEERRSLFEEAAGIGLYRNRKHSTERRLEETALDLQRVEDLIAEVQSQIRSLARQRGKAERHSKLTEEKFAVQLTLARRHLDRLAADAAGMEARFAELGALLPAMRQDLGAREIARGHGAATRATAEAERTELARQLGAVRVELGRLEGDLALAAERLANAVNRRLRAAEERAQMEARAAQATLEESAAGAERTESQAEYDRIRAELADRASEEESGRARAVDARTIVRQHEHELQNGLQRLRALEGERTALEGELASLRERAAQAEAHRAALEGELTAAQRQRDQLVERAAFHAHESRQAAVATDRARHLVTETREHEATQRAARRRADESLSQFTHRRHALEELERDRVGLAPAAAALLAARDRFGNGVLGPLSDFVSTGREDAELAERLLGEWMHAVLVRDEGTVSAIQLWHAEHQPGALVLLPMDPGPVMHADGQPLDERLRVEGPAADWVHAALAGSRVLDGSGRVLRRASGAIFLSGATAPSGPLRRRAEIESLAHDVSTGQAALDGADRALESTVERLRGAEQALAAAAEAADRAREEERQSVAAREDALRILGNLTRELGDSETQLGRVAERLTRSQQRLAEIDASLMVGDTERARLDDALGAERTRLAELETEQETAREARVHWQVQEAHVAARLRAANERLDRAIRTRVDAEHGAEALAAELAQLDADSGALEVQQERWAQARAERQTALSVLESGVVTAESALAAAEHGLADAERLLGHTRHELDTLGDENHRIQIQLTEAAASRRRITDRVEAEWRRPLDTLLEGLVLLDLDIETLEGESSRIVAALEGIGPVNPLAVEEHAEESKRLDFLTSQRDDLVGARQSLIQAIREIDGTARQLFLETFNAVQANFLKVFTTLFGGGECDLRLANADDPLESEIEIHAAPRGKRTQRIHLLSSGERTLVAVSLLFSIYLTKPSPFCLMDEVDAPLDDANVGRFTRLLEEFKVTTQFLVITHNPRTMQSADAVYGVTMQEPGVSTVVGVRLGELEQA
ncbi:MAG: chromosome segregation protein SMC, partial [Gemmatimonadota bacterium]